MDSLLFHSRDYTPLATANVRRQLRRVLEEAGRGADPRMVCRTVTTAINDNASVELTAELVGQTDTRVTVQHYSQRSEVNMATAALLDRTCAKREQ